MVAPQIIITADDFGLDAPTNHAIVRGLAEGLVSNASLLVNLPGFDEACQLAHEHGFADRLGLHFNVTEGGPLTDAMRRTPRFCRDGAFLPQHQFSRRKPLSATEKSAFVAEAQAQLAAARGQGLSLQHFDSHNDVHTEPAIAGVAAAVVRAAGISRVRPARNCGERQGVIRNVQHRSFNAWLSYQGLRQVRYVGTVDDMLWLVAERRLPRQPSVEVVTHPRLGPDDTVADAPFAESLGRRIQRLREALAPTG